MTEDIEDILASGGWLVADVKCPSCRNVWVASLDLDCDSFACPLCNETIFPKKHLVVESETEVN